MDSLKSLMNQFYKLSTENPDELFRVNPNYEGDGWVAAYTKDGKWWSWVGEDDSIDELKSSLVAAIGSWE